MLPVLSVLSVLSVGTVGTYGYYKKFKTGGVTFFFCQTLMGQNECIEYLNISRLYLLTDPLACPVQKQVGPESWNLNLLRASWGRPRRPDWPDGPGGLRTGSQRTQLIQIEFMYYGPQRSYCTLHTTRRDGTGVCAACGGIDKK